MEALLLRCALLAAAVASLGASYRTPNFVIEAPSAGTAEQIGRAAEKYRRELAIEWLGHEMPNWSQPCPITAQVADHLGAGGATSFVFEHGEVFGWRMSIQGSLVRILDSVLPHEVTHTIFATHFRRPLPRWADEGACTTVEHQSERAKQQVMLVDFLRSGRGIAFPRMFAMKDYPHDVMPLYSQGYSLARYLVAQGGKHKFLEFLADGMRDENWAQATKKHYGSQSLAALQDNWLNWVRKGSPIQDLEKDTNVLVAVKTPGPSPESPRPRVNPARPRPSDVTRESNDDIAASPRNDSPSVYELASTGGLKSARAKDESRDKSWRSPRRPAATALATREIEERVGPAADDEPRPAAQHQVTRPQAVQRPRQVILEWSKPPGSETSAADAAPGGGYPTPSPG
jgi:hypothetical protein